MRLRIKDLATKVGSGVTPKGGASVYQDDGIPLFRSQNVTNDGFLLDDIAYISEEIHKSMIGTRLMPNDVLLNITGASIGRCYYLPKNFKEGNVNQHVCIIRPKVNVVIPAFLYYNLISAVGQQMIDVCQTGANREGLTKEDICNFEFDIPSLADQQRMVTYLDTKHSEIDHQVFLLTSKRDAYLRLKKSIINHAVTRGLNPNVKMKDSGIEWIGEVPEHWEMCRFKDAFRRWTTGITPDSKNYKYFESDICKGYTWVTISDFLEKYISQSNLNLSDESIKLFMPPLSLKGSLMFSFKLSVGKIAFADKDLYTNEAIVSIPPNNGQCLEYYYYMLPNVLHENATENIYGAKMLNQKIIANMLMVVPPLPEQRAIATYLDDKCVKIDTIVSNLDKQISRYADLKRSLIDEVITGKRAV